MFGKSKLGISDDDASSLIGSIVEKGVSDDPRGKPFAPTPAPKPAVIPFPVARHRSHGPHWHPYADKRVQDVGDGDCSDDNDEDDEEDRRMLDVADRISALAGPVERKEKKGCDLSHWKEIIRSEDAKMIKKSSSAQARERSRSRVDMNAAERGIGKSNRGNLCSEVGKSDVHMEVDNLDQETSLMTNTCVGGDSEPVIFDEHSSADQMAVDDAGSVQNSMSLESQIDAENRARLQGMTPDEIAKARSEIMDKMDPKLLEVLKRQGLEKLMRKDLNGVGLAPSSQSSSPPVDTQSNIEVSPHLESAGSGHDSMSLESQIDAENLARLQGMTPNEISEAQSEIMHKMDPTLLEKLKRRGHEKLKKKILNGVGSAPSCQSSSLAVDTQSNTEVSPQLEIAESRVVTSTSRKSESGSLAVTAVDSKGPIGGNLWNTWSERVEGIRNLRFSLDGNVVNFDANPVPRTHSAAFQDKQYPDNVTERDFLRTEGDPGAAGYTIKESVELSRSVVPGQRSLALHLLTSVLQKATRNVAEGPVGIDLANDYKSKDPAADWRAVWAFALGPEPELVLSVRMSLDDNHNSVVLACAKAIQCLLCCDLNEQYFDNLESIDVLGMDVYTAPVFRSKAEIDVGFLKGGFWKYSAKSSNLLPFGENTDEDTEGKHTIQDDIVIAGQDFTAGLVRMAILPRIRYLLETDPMSALEECLISVLIAIARHSPRGAKAIMDCPRLVPAVINIFNKTSNTDISQSKIKSVTLLKVLAKSDRRTCLEFINNGTFIAVTRHLYQSAVTLDQWVISGKERCRLSSALMVEQLRLWKACISYGFCLSNFSDIFPALCVFLYPPSVEKLLEMDILREFASVSKEAYLVLGALATRLPEFHLQTSEKDQRLQGNGGGDNSGTWSWGYVGPLVDIGLKWLAFKSEAQVSQLFEDGNGHKDCSTLLENSVLVSLLWVYSALMQMLSAVLEKLDPNNTSDGKAELAWLPDFVPRIGLELLRNGFLCSLSSADSAKDGNDTHGYSFIEGLCYSRVKSNPGTSLGSVCCLHGLTKVVVLLDRLICLAKAGMHSKPIERLDLSREAEILEKGILMGCMHELRSTSETFMNLLTSGWHYLQSIETYGRGGPAPGVGVGWGASGGGFWSINVLLAQKDAAFLIYLLNQMDFTLDEGQPRVSQRIHAALLSCLAFGPRDKGSLEKALYFLLRVPVIRYFLTCFHEFAPLHGPNKLVLAEYKEEDLLEVSNLLYSHFKNRWLCMKKKAKVAGGGEATVGKAPMISTSLNTILEDSELNDNASDRDHDSLMVEWAHQRLPLPVHWFLSPISTVDFAKLGGKPKDSSAMDLDQEPVDLGKVAKAGLLFILGLETLSRTQSLDVSSAVISVPLVWKIHSLSMSLLTGMDVLEDEKSRVLYEALQVVFGQLLDQARHSDQGFILRFQTEIHDSYPTFVETLVDQFGAVSYGDLLYGRQVALYLHRQVESSVRLAAWNALSNARVLELLPPLEKSSAAPEGYLEPAEDNDEILEAYVKSWTSGALDRAATRRSLAFTLFLHHTSSFLFLNRSTDKVLLRNKLVKSLLRDYSRKHQHEGFMLDLIQHTGQPPLSDMEQANVDMEQRLRILFDASEGNVSLVAEVEKLRSALLRRPVVS